jgi:hypothetical protein
MLVPWLAAALLLTTVPTPVGAVSGEPVLERLTDIGASISLGFDVAPLRPELVPPISATPGVPADLDRPSTALSFDLKLGWPGADVLRSVEPYVALGPALFVVEPDYFGRLLGTRVDPTLRLGAKAGAGLNWHLGKDTTLFGAYETTTGFSPRGTRDDVSGFDFTYGIRLRY